MSTDGLTANVCFDPEYTDRERCEKLYQGEIIVYAPRASSLGFCEFARALTSEAFGALDPRSAQHHMPASDYAELLGKLKPSFIHHQRSKELLVALLADFGCDLRETHYDVPRLRSSTSDGYLSTGIAYAWHPHRDTWYSAPPQQINWWMPVWPIRSDNTIAFHPGYFGRVLNNDSRRYNYYEWNAKFRGPHVTKITKSDERPLPRPVEAVVGETLRLVVPAGGLILFSGDMLHSSVPNTSGVTRFSIDFRTVNAGDAAARSGAPCVDRHCTGTSMRDFVRASDRAAMPDDLVALYDDASAENGHLVYT